MSGKSKKKILSRDRIVKKTDKFTSAQFYIFTGVDIEKRRIMLDEHIDEYSIGTVLRGIDKMIDDDSSKPIDVYVSSYGGSVYDCLYLYDVLTSLENCTIRTHAGGKVMSAAFIIFLAGDERYSLPRTSFMMHSISGGAYGKLFEVETEYTEMVRLKNDLLNILSDRTKMNKTWWRKTLRYVDVYYNFDKAKELGIVTNERTELNGN